MFLKLLKSTKLLSLLLLSIVEILASYQKCSNENPPAIPKYYLMEKCHRSTLGMVAKANFTSITSCQRLGIEKKGLALNFSPPEAQKDGGEAIEYTCEVLKCAEADGGLSLVNDTRYDYYSIYAKPLPHVNSTCVPATGMFYLLPDNQNYTQAQLNCRNITGVLADITSEQRTDVLAQLLVGAPVETAFIGLRSKNSSSFIGVDGDGLECSTFRAWAPGHPRRYREKFDCVVLTRNRMWLSTPCNKRFPALCELIPGGPYKHRSIFAARRPKPNNDTLTNEDDKS